MVVGWAENSADSKVEWWEMSWLADLLVETKAACWAVLKDAPKVVHLVVSTVGQMARNLAALMVAAMVAESVEQTVS